MPAPPAEMATSPPAPSSSAPSGVSALSAAVEVLGVAKRTFGVKKRRQTLTTDLRAPRTAEDPVPVPARPVPSHPSRRADVKASPGGSVPSRAGSSSSSRSTVLTMASTATLSSSSSSSSISALSRGHSVPSVSQHHNLSLSHSHSLSRSEDEELVARALPPLGEDQRRALVDFLDRSVDDAYKLCHGFGRVRWSPSKTRAGVAVHRARAEDGAVLDAAVRGRCLVQATVDELLDALATESTAAFVAHERAVNPSEFLDGHVLHTLDTGDEGSGRFACVKWQGVRSLAPSVAKHRDYVYAELVDSFRDASGRRVGYRLSKSVELDALPPSRTALQYVRAKTLALMTFTEAAPGSGAAPGQLELTVMMISDLGERLPAWLVHKVVDTAAMRAACLRDHLQQRRVDLLVAASPKELVPLSKRICCVVCTKSFSLVRKKHHCVACGDVVCAQCAVVQLVSTHALGLTIDGSDTGTDGSNSGSNATPGRRKARICVQCSSGATGELPRRRGSLRPSAESSSSGRSSGQRSDAVNRSFLSDSSGGASSSMDSRPSSFLYPGGMDDSGSFSAPNGSFSASSSGNGGVRKPPPRQQSASMGKWPSERSSKASTTSSADDEASADSEEGAVEVEQRFPQLLGGSILAPTTVELDLGVGKYKETYMMQAQTAEVFELSDGDDDDDAGDFTNTEGDFTSTEGDFTSTEADFTNTEGDFTSTVGDFTNTEGDFTRSEGDFTGSEGDFTRSEGIGRTIIGGLELTPLRAETVDVDDEEVEMASFLTNEENSLDEDEVEASNASGGDVSDSDSDTSNFLTVDENSRIVRMSSSASLTSSGPSRGRTPPPQLPDARESLSLMDGLIVEEMVPENLGGRPSGRRRSVTEYTNAVTEDEDEVPVVIRKVARRVVVGGGRRSRERKPVNPKVQAVVVESIAESESQRAQQQSKQQSENSTVEKPVQAAPTIQLADLQVHLDRMNEISDNLRSLRSGMSATEKKATTQSAMAALESFETKAKADAAAKIAAGFINAFERTRGGHDYNRDYNRASLSMSMASLSASLLLPGVGSLASTMASSVVSLLSTSRGAGYPRTSLFNLTLAMGDGSFREFLVDSTFDDVVEGPDGSGIGWVAVHSHTTGKVYFYNESCGLTSWTLPGPDTYKGAVYMVL